MDNSISVIIPTLNEEKYLPKLLSDLVNQTDKDFEVIIVDGGSDDNTSKIAGQYQDRLTLKFINTNIKNVSLQRNNGAKQAKGNYLFFIDADMRLSRGFIKKVKSRILKSQHLIYLFKLIPEKGHIEDKIAFGIINNLLEASQYTPKPFAPGGNMILQRDFFNFLGGFNEKAVISEDHEIIQRAKRRGVSTKFLTDINAKFSMRRFHYEGRMKIFLKYLVASFYNIKSGVVDRRLFDYQMGGKRYFKTDKEKNNGLSKIDEYLQKVKKYLEEI